MFALPEKGIDYAQMMLYLGALDRDYATSPEIALAHAGEEVSLDFLRGHRIGP
jgi:hypothetical protein